MNNLFYTITPFHSHTTHPPHHHTTTPTLPHSIPVTPPLLSATPPPLTNVNRTMNLVISPSIRPSDICKVPSTSKAGIKKVVRAMLRTLAMAKRMSETISGSSGFHSNLAAFWVSYRCVRGL